MNGLGERGPLGLSFKIIKMYIYFSRCAEKTLMKVL